MAGQANFVIQPYLTSIALAYKNSKLIADDVLPRSTVERQVFKYNAYAKGDAFTVPNTYVGRTSAPRQLDWSATETTSATRDYALDHAIPAADLLNTQGDPSTPIDPRARSTELLTDLIALDREVRVANLVFNTASYASYITLTSNGSSGGYQFNDYTNSDPIATIMGQLDTMIMRANVMVIGRLAWTKLISHPKLVKAFYGNAADAGIVTKSFIANLFELDDILVGESWVNSAKPGQTVSLTRVWGKHIALLYRNPMAVNSPGAITFGQTFQWGPRIAGTVDNDPSIGMRGGSLVRVGESVKELVLANDCGIMIQNAVA